MAAHGQAVAIHPTDGPLLVTVDRNGYDLRLAKPGDIVAVEDPLGYPPNWGSVGGRWFGRLQGIRQRIGHVQIEPASGTLREGQYERVANTPGDVSAGNRLVVVEHGSWTFDNDRESRPLQHRRWTECEFLHQTVVCPYDAFITCE